MELVEKLRIISESFGWVFNYGRRDFGNLVEADDEQDPKWYFFLDPVIRTPESNTIIYEGYFMLLSKSDLDQTYDGQKETDINDGKWRVHIKPKLELIINEFTNQLTCAGDYEILHQKITDVINYFDENFDGVLVNFKIKQYL